MNPLRVRWWCETATPGAWRYGEGDPRRSTSIEFRGLAHEVVVVEGGACFVAVVERLVHPDGIDELPPAGTGAQVVPVQHCEVAVVGGFRPLATPAPAESGDADAVDDQAPPAPALVGIMAPWDEQRGVARATRLARRALEAGLAPLVLPSGVVAVGPGGVPDPGAADCAVAAWVARTGGGLWVIASDPPGSRFPPGVAEVVSAFGSAAAERGIDPAPRLEAHTWGEWRTVDAASLAARAGTYSQEEQR